MKSSCRYCKAYKDKLVEIELSNTTKSSPDFLGELTNIRTNAIKDQENITMQASIVAFKNYVLMALEPMRPGIENEFRRKVKDEPYSTQHHVIRTLYVTVPEEIEGCVV